MSSEYDRCALPCWARQRHNLDGSLVLGVASAAAAKSDVLLAGVAGLVAGAMSMAAGEYVSVHSQSDSEHADLEREKRELSENPKFEKES